MSNIESLFFYLISFSIAAVLMFLGIKRNNKVIVWASLAIPMIVSALRFDVGTDYPTYIALYNQFSTMLPSDYLTNQTGVEAGFYVLSHISAFITGNSSLLFAFFGIFTILFFYLGIKRYTTQHHALLYFLFLTIIFPISFNLVRQGLAISIAFYAVPFIMERKFLKYVLWIIVGSLFHKSILILLPIYFLNRIIKKDSGEKILKGHISPFTIKVVAIAAITYVSIPYIFNFLLTLPIFSKYELYQTVTGDGNNYVFYLKALVLVIILLFYRKLAIFKYTKFFLLFVAIDLVLSTVGFNSSFLKRIGLYFALFSPLLLVHIPDFFKDRFGKFVSYAILIAYGLVYFYLSYYVLVQGDIIPYQFIGSQ